MLNNRILCVIYADKKLFIYICIDFKNSHTCTSCIFQAGGEEEYIRISNNP